MMRIYWINTALQAGAIGMMARPRGGDWLADDLRKLQLHGVDRVVSLLEYSEVLELELKKEERRCTDLGIQYTSFPIRDRGLPEAADQFLQLVEGLYQDLQAGKKVVIHCRMGIGRTSVLAGALLIRDGFTPENVFSELSKIRTLTVPDTEAQVAWTLGLQGQLRRGD